MIASTTILVPTKSLFNPLEICEFYDIADSLSKVSASVDAQGGAGDIHRPGLRSHGIQGRDPGRSQQRVRLMLNSLVPGALVRHPDARDWGIGQIQSAIGSTITVNFEHRGKVVINADRISLELVKTD